MGSAGTGFFRTLAALTALAALLVMGSAGTGFFRTLAPLTALAALLAMGSAGTGFFRTLAALTALALRFLAAESSAFFFCTAAQGFSWSMVRMFFRGLVFTTARFTFLLGALSTFLMASLLRRADKSVLAILGWGKFQLFLTELGLRQVP